MKLFITIGIILALGIIASCFIYFSYPKESNYPDDKPILVLDDDLTVEQTLTTMDLFNSFNNDGVLIIKNSEKLQIKEW